jgi:mRNA-degrading endonuclease RelE of RelBE toxin-antitoxin system
LSKYEIDPTFKPFQKSLKHLKKKFKNTVKDISRIFSQLENEAPLGIPIPHIGVPVYKVRVRNTSIPKGKSGGFRLIYKFDEENGIITPMFLYSKSEKPDATIKEIQETLKYLDDEKE